MFSTKNQVSFHLKQQFQIRFFGNKGTMMALYLSFAHLRSQFVENSEKEEGAIE